MKQEQITSNPKEFLTFMRELGMGVYHNSNLFFRDIQYATSEFMRTKEGKLPRYAEAEALANQIVTRFLEQGILDRIDEQAFRLNFPAFELPRPAAAPKPAEATQSAAV